MSGTMAAVVASAIALVLLPTGALLLVRSRSRTQALSSALIIACGLLIPAVIASLTDGAATGLIGPFVVFMVLFVAGLVRAARGPVGQPLDPEQARRLLTLQEVDLDTARKIAAASDDDQSSSDGS